MKHERATLPTPTSSSSFWHSEPNELLIGHRTTEQLPAEADIVIVGSGITGTSVARYLSEDERAKGKSIVLLEAREACWGATGRVSRNVSSITATIFALNRFKSLENHLHFELKMEAGT
jgi:myosin-crossreactive antigen